MHGGPCRRALVEKGDRLLAAIALNMKPSLYVAQERPEPLRLYIVVTGIAMDVRSHHILRAGSNFGIEAIIPGSAYDSAGSGAAHIKCLMTSALLFITREAFFELLRAQPTLAEAYSRLRLWGLYRRLKMNWHRAAASRRNDHMQGERKQPALHA